MNIIKPKLMVKQKKIALLRWSTFNSRSLILSCSKDLRNLFILQSTVIKWMNNTISKTSWARLAAHIVISRKLFGSDWLVYSFAKIQYSKPRSIDHNKVQHMKYKIWYFFIFARSFFWSSTSGVFITRQTISILKITQTKRKKKMA